MEKIIHPFCETANPSFSEEGLITKKIGTFEKTCSNLKLISLNSINKFKYTKNISLSNCMIIIYTKINH